MSACFAADLGFSSSASFLHTRASRQSSSVSSGALASNVRNSVASGPYWLASKSRSASAVGGGAALDCEGVNAEVAAVAAAAAKAAAVQEKRPEGVGTAMTRIATRRSGGALQPTRGRRKRRMIAAEGDYETIKVSVKHVKVNQC